MNSALERVSQWSAVQLHALREVAGVHQVVNPGALESHTVNDFGQADESFFRSGGFHSLSLVRVENARQVPDAMDYCGWGFWWNPVSERGKVKPSCFLHVSFILPFFSVVQAVSNALFWTSSPSSGQSNLWCLYLTAFSGSCRSRLR